METEKIAQARLDWIEKVRDAWAVTDDVDMGEYVEISIAKWNALCEAIKAPVRIK
jgi:hypothetical protein